MSLYLLRDVCLFIILYVLELTNEIKERIESLTKELKEKYESSTKELKETIEASTNEIKEENRKVSKENTNYIRDDIAGVAAQVSHLRKELRICKQSEERSTHGQKTSPGNPGETALGELDYDLCLKS